MAWFKGKLYVGTNRFSAEQAIDAQFPLLGQLEGFHNQGNDGAAEIWCYTPQTNTWERVYKSPTDIPIPNQPGKFAARDNGFRSMAVFTEADGTQALYVGGVVYPGAAPGVNVQARILRTTDGINFNAIPEDPGTFLGDFKILGDLKVESYRAMTVYQGHLYVTAGSIIGEGVILEAANPAGGDNSFRQVSPPGLTAFEMQVFNGFLYVGAVEPSLVAGYTVFKTDASPTNTPYYNFIPVVTDGGYYGSILGASQLSVLSMAVFDGGLYVGSTTDLIRIEPNDTWELIVGNPRRSPGGVRHPISGLPSGFGNPFVVHLWRMAVYHNTLYVGTWDTSTYFRPLPLIGPIASKQAGFDLWSSEDGVHWTEITANGFGDPYNYAVRSLVATPVGLFLGTVNPWEGTQVWLGV
jgi:hypothetical protein